MSDEQREFAGFCRVRWMPPSPVTGVEARTVQMHLIPGHPRRTRAPAGHGLTPTMYLEVSQ